MNDSREVLEIAEQSINLDKLMESVSFNLDAFEDANLSQPRLYLQAARYLTWAVLQKARSEYQLDIKSAELAIKFRDNLEKATEKRIEQELAANKDIQKLRKSAYVAKVVEVWAKQLVEVYNHRLQVLNNITKIRSSEITNELRAVKERAAVKELRDESDRVRRKVMRSAEEED